MKNLNKLYIDGITGNLDKHLKYAKDAYEWSLIDQQEKKQYMSNEDFEIELITFYLPYKQQYEQAQKDKEMFNKIIDINTIEHKQFMKELIELLINYLLVKKKLTSKTSIIKLREQFEENPNLVEKICSENNIDLKQLIIFDWNLDTELKLNLLKQKKDLYLESINSIDSEIQSLENQLFDIQKKM